MKGNVASSKVCVRSSFAVGVAFLRLHCKPIASVCQSETLPYCRTGREVLDRVCLCKYTRTEACYQRGEAHSDNREQQEAAARAAFQITGWRDLGQRRSSCRKFKDPSFSTCTMVNIWQLLRPAERIRTLERRLWMNEANGWMDGWYGFYGILYISVTRCSQSGATCWMEAVQLRVHVHSNSTFLLGYWP